MTLDISTVNIIISGALSALGGWLLASLKAQRNRNNATDSAINDLKLKLAELRGDLNVEIANRIGISADISRIEDGVKQLNEKLDKLILRSK